MKIEGLEISDFRGIGHLKLDFRDELGRIRERLPIVGPNTSGKTTILDAIALCLMPTTELAMPELWLICEGGSDHGGGIDKDILSRVFTQVLPAGIVVESAGGDTSLKAAASFIRRQRRGVVAYVSDR